MTVQDKAVQWGLSIAADQSHGYSQQVRWGPDYDCSSFAISCYKTGAGVPINTSVVNYTGNLQKLTQFGFKDVSKSVNFNTGSGLQKGDIVYYHKSGTSGHAVVYIGNGQIVHARGQRYGSSKTGDQGTEIAVTAYYSGSFNKCLRYVGGDTASTTPTVTTGKKRYAVSTSLPIIKKGSIGKAVKIWQIIIGVEADGEFGPKTDKATKQFQKAYKLEVDGEVGSKTWGAGLAIIE